MGDGKDLEGNNLSLIEILSRNLLGGTENIRTFPPSWPILE
jgi:hypothetical protein